MMLGRPMPWIRKQLAELVNADPPTPPPFASRTGLMLAAMVQVAALIFLALCLRNTLLPMVTVPYPATPALHGKNGARMGMSAELQQTVFRELAEAEVAERAAIVAANNWNGHAWSQEDDRGWQERTKAREIAVQHGLRLSQVYWVLDTAIRERWPGPGGKPLKATVPPIELRHE